MKRILLIIPLAFLLLACEKTSEKQVTYFITGPISGFEVNYRVAEGTLLSERIETSSAEDEWKYIFSAEEGDIVFVSAIYTDISSAITVQVLINGKLFKQGSSSQDTVKYVTVSGTVPFD